MMILRMTLLLHKNYYNQNNSTYMLYGVLVRDTSPDEKT